MKKAWKKKLLVAAGSLLIIILILNFGLNMYLKYQLPSYIKDNTDYAVNYDKMDVDVFTGNIHITEIKVDSKQPQNLDILALKGSVKDLQISRIGIWSALFNKEIAPSSIRLEEPNLEVRLAKKKVKKGKKSKMTFDFDDLEILNGTVTIYNTRMSKMTSLSNFSLNIKGFEKIEKTDKRIIPFEFDSFEMNAKNIFVRPTAEQLITAKSVATKDNGLYIENLQLIPLLTQKQFQKYYPKKKQQIKLASKSIFVSKIDAKSNKITLDKLIIKNPDITIYKTSFAEYKKQKSINLDVNMGHADINNASVKVVASNAETKFLVSGLNVKADDFVFDDESSKEKIPFRYKNLEASGQNIQVDTDRQSYRIQEVKISPKEGSLTHLVAKTTREVSDKTTLNYTLGRLSYKINEWSFVESKLKLDVNEVVAENISGSAKAPMATVKKVVQESGMYDPVKFQNIKLKNITFNYEKNGQPFSIKNFNINLANVEIAQKQKQQGNDVKVGDYSFDGNALQYSTKFYTISVGKLSGNKSKIDLSNFGMKPRVSRNEFVRSIPVEQDLYTISIPKISMNGSWDFMGAKKFVAAKQLHIMGMNANIFRSKLPKDDPKVKPMYSELLRKIKIPLQIEQTRIQNSTLVYEEDTEKSNGPGKLTFGNFNMTIQNLNSGKTKGASTKVPIKIDCSFMNVSPMAVNWTIDTASSNDAFSISGTINSLPANNINAFIEPYLKVRAKGSIQLLSFNFHGDKTGILGQMKMKHKDLEVSILNKQGDKNKLLSSIANVFVKTNSKKIPESVEVEKVQRDPTKSFFNLFWKGIQEGLKKSLI